MSNLSLPPHNGHRAKLRRIYHLTWDPSFKSFGLAARVDVLADELRYFLEDGFKEVSAENRRGLTRPCSIVLEDDNGVHFDVDLAGVSPTDNDVSLLSPRTSLKLICIRAVRRDGATSKFDIIFPDGFEHKGHRIDISKIKRAAS
jgi:hypothetical protein